MMNRAMRRGKWPFNGKTTKDIVKAMETLPEITDEERDRILRDLDQTAAQKLFPMISAAAILPMLHKVRYEVTSMPDELRHESRTWLEVNGFKRMRDMPWPDPGVLEK